MTGRGRAVMGDWGFVWREAARSWTRRSGSEEGLVESS